MKKKIVTILLCIALSISCATPVLATEASEATTTEAVNAYKKTSKKKLKKRLKKKYGLKFGGNVPNDMTGNWRWAEYYSDTGFEGFAVDYYKAYVKDDSEIHGVINRKTNIIYRMNCIYNLNITSLEYATGEESDAKKMFGGDPIVKYEIDPYYEESKDIPIDLPESSPLEFVPCNSEQKALVASVKFVDEITRVLYTADIPIDGSEVIDVGNYKEWDSTFFSVDFKIKTADERILLANCSAIPDDEYPVIFTVKDINTGHAYYNDNPGPEYDYATDTVIDGSIRILEKYQLPGETVIVAF